MPVGCTGDERRSSCVGLKACTAMPSSWFLCFHWLFQLVSVYLPGFEVRIGTDAGIPGLKSPGYSDYLSSIYLDLAHSQKRFLSMSVTWCLIAFYLLSWQFKYYFWYFVSCISYDCFWFFWTSCMKCTFGCCSANETFSYAKTSLFAGVDLGNSSLSRHSCNLITFIQLADGT